MVGSVLDQRLEHFSEKINMDLQNVHLDLLKQFHLQQVHMEATLQLYQQQQSVLNERIRYLEAENERLKKTY